MFVYSFGFVDSSIAQMILEKIEIWQDLSINTKNIAEDYFMNETMIASREILCEKYFTTRSMINKPQKAFYDLLQALNVLLHFTLDFL